MKPRMHKAQILEDNYMAKLKNILADEDPLKSNEIIQNIRDHIEEAVNESPGNEISAAQMAEILERLGPPESYISSHYDPRQKKQDDIKSAPENSNTIIETPKIFNEFLDKLWIAMFIGVVGLYIPIINLYFCTIIFLVFIIIIFNKYFPDKNGQMNSISKLALAQIILMTIYCVTSVLGIMTDLMSLVNVPLSIAIAVISLIIDWQILGKICNILNIFKYYELDQYVQKTRIRYIIVSFLFCCVSLMVGMYLGLKFHSKQDIYKMSLIEPIFILPIAWVIGWFFLLRPISKVRSKIIKGDKIK